MTGDLFGAPPLPGLSTFDDLIDASEETSLTAAIDGTHLTPFRFQQWTGRRLTSSFGMSYDFEGGRLEPAPDMPDWLLPIRERAAKRTGLAADELVQALLIRYDPGAGIGWHRDRPVFDHVVGISLGAPAEMRFRRRVGTRFERFSIPLPPRGGYHLSGEARHVWEHSIAELDRTRWSITFRSLRRSSARVVRPPVLRAIHVAE